MVYLSSAHSCGAVWIQPYKKDPEDLRKHPQEVFTFKQKIALSFPSAALRTFNKIVCGTETPDECKAHYRLHHTHIVDVVVMSDGQLKLAKNPEVESWQAYAEKPKCTK